MVVSNGHAAVTASAAIDLDRGIRYQLTDAVMRPAYARNFRDQLSNMTATADGAITITGRYVWLKRLIARVLRPFQHRQAQFNSHTTERFAELFDLITSLMNSRAETMTVLLADLRARVENIRTELFLEMRSLNSAPLQGAMDEARANAILKTMKETPRLHLGCMTGKREGYLNIDDAPSPHVELIQRLDQLPTKPGSVAELVATRVIERYSMQEFTNQLLPAWISALRKGGRLVIATSDLERATESLQQGTITEQEFVKCLYGTQVRPPETFRSAYTPNLLQELLTQAGLDDVTITARRQNLDLPAFEFEVEAYKVAA